MNDGLNPLAIYLAGAITNQADDGLGWRIEFKEKYGNKYKVISPEDKWAEMANLRMTSRWAEACVTGERRDIQNSNAVIAKIRPNSYGTAIGIVYAFLSGKTVVLFDEDCESTKKEHVISPILEFHSHGRFATIDGCVDFIDRRHARNSANLIRDWQGNEHDWSSEEIVSEISSTIESLQSSIQKRFDYLDDLEADRYADAVKMQIEDRVESGELTKSDVNPQLINKTVESIMINNSYRDEVESLARHFIQKQISKEFAQLNLKNGEESHSGADAILISNLEKLQHDLKSKMGNIRRNIERIRGSVSDTTVDDCASRILTNVTSALDLLNEAKANIRQGSSGQVSSVANLIKEWKLQIPTNSVPVFTRVVPENLSVRFGSISFETWLQVFYDNAVQHGFAEESGQQFFIKCELRGESDVIFEIWNTGKKITKALADRIFGEGDVSSGEDSGWGVGLKSIKRDILFQLSGTIICNPISVPDMSKPFETEPAETGFPRFRIELPNFGKIDHGKLKILIADDRDEDRSDIAACLSPHFEIIECSTIDEAKDTCRLLKNELYGAVLDFDFNDPDSRDGIWLCKELLIMNPNLIVAMASGKNSWSSPDGHWMERAIEAGARQTFAKDEYTDSDLLKVFGG